MPRTKTACGDTERSCAERKSANQLVESEKKRINHHLPTGRVCVCVCVYQIHVFITLPVDTSVRNIMLESRKRYVSYKKAWAEDQIGHKLS